MCIRDRLHTRYLVSQGGGAAFLKSGRLAMVAHPVRGLCWKCSPAPGLRHTRGRASRGSLLPHGVRSPHCGRRSPVRPLRAPRGPHCGLWQRAPGPSVRTLSDHWCLAGVSVVAAAGGKALCGLRAPLCGADGGAERAISGRGHENGGPRRARRRSQESSSYTAAPPSSMG